MPTGFRGSPRARRIAAGLAIGAGAAVIAAVSGVGAATADTTTPAAPGPVAHHHFSPAATRVGAGRTPQERAALTKQVLGEAAGKNLQNAYDVQPLFDRKIDGTGKTIATLVSYGDKNIKQYIDSYDQQQGLPAADVETIEPAGTVPACTDPGTPQDCPGWGGETDLDVAMMHTLAPGAKILIIATPTSETQGINGLPEMMKAMDYVADNKKADVISMSFGTPEDDFDSSAQLHDLDQHFKKAVDAGITLLASSGDDGSTGKKKDNSPWGKQVVSFPAASSYVTAVGGTVLSIDGSGKRTQPDVLWSMSGGGVSHEYPLPDWQTDVATSTGAKGRSLPDITMQGVEGTSQSSPLMAAVIGLAAQSAGKNLGFVDPALYAIGPKGADAGVVDVTSGNNANSGVPGFSAGQGFDIASGWGTVDAAKFVPALVKQIG